MHNNIMKRMKEYNLQNPMFIECQDIRDLENSHIFGLALEVLKEATDEFAQLPDTKVNYIC